MPHSVAIKMSRLINYVDTSFGNNQDNELLYKFKKKLISSMTDRANEITHAGLTNEQVIDDIVISEHPDLKKEFEDYKIELANKTAKKKQRQKTFWGSVAYLVAVIIVFLAISLIKHTWNDTWVFLINGICLYLAYMFINSVITLTEKRSVFYPLPRLLLCLSVFLFAVPVFLILNNFLNLQHAWLTFLFAVLVMFSADGVYAENVSERFAIFFHLGYIPPAMTMIYIILGTLNIIPWNPGWLLIPFSFLIVLTVVLIRMHKHKKERIQETEDDAEWKED